MPANGMSANGVSANSMFTNRVMRAGLWAPTSEAASEADHTAIHLRQVPQTTLMENAGRSAAQILHHLWPRGRIVALVGSGNNGGDALVLLRSLASWGRSCDAILVGNRTLGDRTVGDPLLHGWDADIDFRLASDGEWAGLLNNSDSIIVDGLLGTGLRGSPTDLFAEVILAANRSPAPILSLDIPSGANGSTGEIAGHVIDADVTVAFGWAKLGTLLFPARRHVGRLIVSEIGFPASVESSTGYRIATSEWAHGHKPVRSPTAHKNQAGRLLLLAGSEGMAGAAVMSARAALRGGVGFLRIASVEANREILQSSVPEAVFVPVEDDAALTAAIAASDALAIGPGWGVENAVPLRFALACGEHLPLVLDAGALTAVAEGQLPTLAEIAKSRPLIVTPHPGEMARLTDPNTQAITREPAVTARRAAERWGCSVLLKGRPSLVAEPDGRGWVETVGSSDFAAAGMGDVLAGTVGALLAQGVATGVAGALALHLTGRAAIRASLGTGLTPSDVIEGLPGALAEGISSPSDIHLPFILLDQPPAH